MLKVKVMKKAHIIAKNELEGDYVARLSIALKKAWKQVKNIFEEAESDMQYKGIEISCTGEMNWEDIPEPFERKDVYITASDDREEKIRINGVSDKAIAKANEKIFVEYFAPQTGEVKFNGDTYNNKEEIKDFAKKHNSKAKFQPGSKTWTIQFSPDNEQEAVEMLKDLKQYDMSRKTVYGINEIIESLEG